MSFIQRAILQTKIPSLDFKRFRGKINIQKPKKPHFERQLYMDLCKPIYIDRNEQKSIDLCAKLSKPLQSNIIENPFETILARECINWFNHSKMVVFLHMNSLKMDDKMKVFVALKKQNMHLRTYGRKIVEMAVNGTNYEAIKPLFISHSNIIFCQNPDVSKMLRILKKAPQMVLMGAILNGKLMSKTEIIEFNQMPNLKTAQAQLCAVMQSAASHIVTQLNQHQSTLVSHLDTHVDLLGKPKKEAVNSTEEPANVEETKTEG